LEWFDWTIPENEASILGRCYMRKFASFAILVALSLTYSAQSQTFAHRLCIGERLSIPSTYPALTHFNRESTISPTATVPNPRWERWLYGAAGHTRAIELQKELNVPLVVYFYTDWCPYCRALDNDYLPTAPVQDYLRGVVKVRINPEQGQAERALAQRYGVQGFPSFFVARESAVSPVNVQPFRRAGKLTPAQFANACRAVAPGSRKVAAVQGTGTSGKFRERSTGVEIKETTTKGGTQIQTVVPGTTASQKKPGRQ
jgi:thiol-disulfide isomerase/thioredoxin